MKAVDCDCKVDHGEGASNLKGDGRPWVPGGEIEPEVGVVLKSEGPNGHHLYSS